MRKSYRTISTLLVMLTLGAAAWSAPGEYLTGPSERPPLEIVSQYIQNHAAELGLSPADMADFHVDERYSNQTGSTHFYLTQRHEGVRVHNAILNATVSKDGRLVTLGNRWVSGLAGKVVSSEAAIAMERAPAAAAEHFDLTPVAPFERLPSRETDGERVRFTAAGVSRSDILVHPLYLPRDGKVYLTWAVEIQPVDSPDWWWTFIDAETGAVLDKQNMVISDSFLPTDEHPARWVEVKGYQPSKAPYNPMRKTTRGTIDGSAYLALPLTIESPIHGDFQVIQDPAHAGASPFGWHDTDGVAGAEFTITRGNNVHAFQDRDGDRESSGDEPDGGAELQFNFPFNPELSPALNVDPATVNLFVWNNFSHDVTFFHGFDESANFQEINYTGVGLGGDSVNALAQQDADNGTANNATFGTPSDGSSPTMNMFEWRAPGLSVSVTSPEGLLEPFFAGSANFGPDITEESPLVGELALVQDQITEDSTSAMDGCETLLNPDAVNGKIAVIMRGDCSFVSKVLNAQAAGAIGAIIVNNAGDSHIGLVGWKTA